MPPEITSSENIAGTTTESSVTSGTASDAMVKAAMAASSAEESPAGTDATTAAAPTGTGDPAKPALATGEGATSGAKGPQVPTGQAAPAPTGPVPADRHIAAVNNAREKAVAETEAKYAWAKGVDPQSANIAFDVASQLLSNPQAFVQKLAKELGLQVTRAGQPAAAEVVEEMPAADLEAMDGRKAYSDTAVLKIVDIATRKLEAKLNGQLKPVFDAHQQESERGARADIIRQAQATVQETTEKLRKMPYVTPQSEPIILEYLMAIPQQERNRIGTISALYQAYNTFLAERVFPNIETAAEQRVRDGFKKKAATSIGSGHPVAQGGDGQKVDIKGVDGLAAHMARLEAAMSAQP